MEVSADTTAPLVVFDRVTKRYKDRVVIEQLSFTIARNEFVRLTGREGSGKSTVLRLIAALESPTAGTIRIAGVPLAAVARRALPLLRRSVGFVPQETVLLHDRSAIENVALPLAAAGVGKSEARARAASALQRVGLTKDEALTLASRLSGGARRRAAWARALVSRPALLLVDEPLAGPDETSSAVTQQLLEQILTSGVTVLLATRISGVPFPAATRTISLDPAMSA